MRRLFPVGLLTVLLLSTTHPCVAATIIKLDLGTDGDLELVGSTLSTTDDGVGATLGDQNTNVNYTGFLSGNPDIVMDIASFSLDQVALNGPATVFAGIVVQPTLGGTISLWDPANSLLLAAVVNDGSIAGPLGGSATGAFANLTLGTITGGSLAPLLKPNSFSISFAFTDVNGGAGFSTADGKLQPFVAAATANMAAESVPEPATCVLASLGILAWGVVRSRRAASIGSTA